MNDRDIILQNIKDELEAEFCPPLDTSLFAAIFSEFEYSPKALVELRDTFKELAAGAHAGDQSMTSQIQSASGIDSGSDSVLPSAYNTNFETMEPPVAFLRSAFPDFPTRVLQDAVDNQNATFNMEEVVESLLASELLARPDSEITDNTSSKLKGDSTFAATRKKKPKPKKKPERIILGDTRPRQMAPPSERYRKGQLDPWTQLASIAEYLSTLLPCPASGFLSAFHSPNHPTAFHAVVAYIDSSLPSNLSEETVDHRLISMSEVMSTGADEEEWDAQLARKCIHVTGARLSDAIDLYNLLMDLKEICPVNHLPAPIRIPSGSTPRTTAFPNSPKSPRPRGELKPHPQISTYPSSKPDNASEWQVVKRRAPKSSKFPPPAEVVPENRGPEAVPARETRSIAEFITEKRNEEQGWQEKRRGALQKAAQHWQRSRGAFGSQVAAYYAEEAGKYLIESRAAAVEAARALVVRNRARSENLGYNTHNAVDLHGMRREEAIAIVKEELAARSKLQDASRREEPLQFITGKGNHSAGNKSVLLPAIRDALRSEGWNFVELEAGIVVYGKR